MYEQKKKKNSGICICIWVPVTSNIPVFVQSEQSKLTLAYQQKNK